LIQTFTANNSNVVGQLTNILSQLTSFEFDEIALLSKDMKTRFVRIDVLRTFIKKTQKTPRKEIKLALERAKEVKHDQNH